MTADPPGVDAYCDSCGYSFRVGRDVVADSIQCPMCGEPVTRDQLRGELTHRVEAAARQVASLQQQLAAMIDASRDDNADDEHDPEGSTIAFERQQLASLLDRAVRSHHDALRALEQLDAGTYGICETCGRPIAPERLEARPEATQCIDCARRR